MDIEDRRHSKIEPDSWHYKLFTLGKQITEAFIGNEYWYDQPSSKTKVDLCSYMRTIMIWGPLCTLAHILFYAFILFVTVWFPISVAGGLSYLWMLIILVCVAGAIAGIAGFFWTADKATAAYKSYKLGRPEPTGPTFRGLIREYYWAVKQRICPILEVEEK